MDRTVARLNIEHYRKLLDEEVDQAKRQIILRLLAEEEAKLVSLKTSPGKRQSQLGLLPPFPPVGWLNVDPFFCFHLHPPTQDTAARKNEGMRSVPVNDGQLKIPVEGRNGYRFPLHPQNVTCRRGIRL